MFDDRKELDRVARMLALYYPFTYVDVQKALVKYKSVDLLIKAMKVAYDNETELELECQQIFNK